MEMNLNLLWTPEPSRLFPKKIPHYFSSNLPQNLSKLKDKHGHYEIPIPRIPQLQSLIHIDLHSNDQLLFRHPLVRW